VKRKTGKSSGVSLPVFLVIASALFVSGCASSPRQRDALAENAVVAVTHIDYELIIRRRKQDSVTIDFTKTDKPIWFIIRRIDDLKDLIPRLSGNAVDKAKHKVAFLEYFRNLDGEAYSDRKYQESIREYTVDLMNRNFADRGYSPIQRARIESIVEEQKLQLAGFTEDIQDIGKLTRADSVCTGKMTIVIEEKRGIQGFLAMIFSSIEDDYEITFSADISDVESGIILFSNGVTKKGSGLSMKIVEKTVGTWFRALPKVR
jgi:hypothetical protein